MGWVGFDSTGGVWLYHNPRQSKMVAREKVSEDLVQSIVTRTGSDICEQKTIAPMGLF